MKKIYYANKNAKKSYKQYKGIAQIVYKDKFNPDIIDFSKPIIPVVKKKSKKINWIVGNVLLKTNKDQLEIVFQDLEKELDSILVHKTVGFSKKTALLYVMKITSVPIGFLACPVKKYFLGDKEKTKRCLKDKVIIAPNHTSVVDPPFLYQLAFFRNIRAVAISNIFKNSFLNWVFSHAGVIKYERDRGFDLKCFKEINGILNGNGIVAMFPQGHIIHEGDSISEFKPGLAMISLRNNAPIIPFYFKENTKLFHVSHCVVGEPIIPSEIYGSDYKTSSELVDDFTKKLQDKFIEFDTHTIKELKERYNG